MTRSVRTLHLYLKHPHFRNAIKCNIASRQSQRLFSSTNKNSQQNLNPASKSNASKILGFGAAALLTGSVSYYIYKSSKNKPPMVSEILESRLQSESLPSAKFTEIPEFVPYLIIGGGTASFSAARAIRTKDPKARVLIITKENHLPYMRPPLSKEIWNRDLDLNNINDLTFKQWNGKERSLYFEGDEFYVTPLEVVTKENGGIGVLKNTAVVGINANKLKIKLDNGHEIAFKKCLIATGGSPKIPHLFENIEEKLKEKIVTFRSIEDFQKISKLIQTDAKSITIIGGGFLGSELACALSRHQEKFNLKITQVFTENGMFDVVLPQYLSDYTTRKIQDLKVKTYCNKEVQGVKKGPNDTVELQLNNGENIQSDLVVLATGIKPNDDLAAKAGFEIDSQKGGIMVNSEFAVSSNIWSAGDVASFYDPKFLCRRRVEHHDHSLVSGKLAGENMAGSEKKYTHQSMFWCDLTDNLSFEAIGLIDSSLQTVGVFRKSEDNADQHIEKAPQIPQMGDKYEKGLVFYLKNDIVVGIVLWNIFGKVPIARKIINEAQHYEDLTEVAKLFELEDSNSLDE